MWQQVAKKEDLSSKLDSPIVISNLPKNIRKGKTVSIVFGYHKFPHPRRRTYPQWAVGDHLQSHFFFNLSEIFVLRSKAGISFFSYFCDKNQITSIPTLEEHVLGGNCFHFSPKNIWRHFWSLIGNVNRHSVPLAVKTHFVRNALTRELKNSQVWSEKGILTLSCSAIPPMWTWKSIGWLWVADFSPSYSRDILRFCDSLTTDLRIFVFIYVFW